TVKGLFKTIDAGANWSVVTNGLRVPTISALAINPSSPAIIYAGTLGISSFGGFDVFLTKLTPGITSVVYSVVFGGNAADESRALAIDSAGHDFVAGSTASSDFPTFEALGFPGTFNSGGNDAFVTALNSDASAYVYSTYLGGSGYDAAS